MNFIIIIIIYYLVFYKTVTILRLKRHFHTLNTVKPDTFPSLSIKDTQTTNLQRHLIFLLYGPKERTPPYKMAGIKVSFTQSTVIIILMYFE